MLLLWDWRRPADFEDGKKLAALELRVEIIPRNEAVVALRLKQVKRKRSEGLRRFDNERSRLDSLHYLSPLPSQSHLAMSLERTLRWNSGIDLENAGRDRRARAGRTGCLSHADSVLSQDSDDLRVAR
jgi:hypothetical protein